MFFIYHALETVVTAFKTKVSGGVDVVENVLGRRCWFVPAAPISQLTCDASSSPNLGSNSR